MTLQGVCQRPMAQRAAIEIGTQGQDQADVGAATQRRIGEARQQHSTRRICVRREIRAGFQQQHTAAGLGAEARRQALPTENNSPS